MLHQLEHVQLLQQGYMQDANMREGCEQHAHMTVAAARVLGLL